MEVSGQPNILTALHHRSMPVPIQLESCVGSRIGLDDFEKNKFLDLARIRNTGSPTP
jgi:hypothetical protein